MSNIKDRQYRRKSKPAVSRIKEKECRYTGWRVCDVEDAVDTEFLGIPEVKSVRTQKCRSLDENNIVVSSHLLVEPLSSYVQDGPLKEDLQATRQLSAKCFSFESCSTRALNVHQDKQLQSTPNTAIRIDSFLPTNTEPRKAHRCRNPSDTSFKFSRIKQILSLTHGSLSTPFTQKAMQTAISKEKDVKVRSHHLTYTDCAFQGFSAVYPKETVPTTLQDLNHNNFCADHARLKSASGSNISDEIRALGNTSQSCSSMILGNNCNVGDQIKINHIQHLLDPGISSCCSPNCCVGSLVQAMAQHNLQCMPSSLQRVAIKRCHPNKGQHPTRQRGRNMSYQQNQQVIEIPWRRVQRDTARFSEQTIGSGKQRPEAMERFCEPDSQRYQTAAEPEMPKDCVTVPLILQVIRERMNQASTARSPIH